MRKILVFVAMLLAPGCGAPAPSTSPDTGEATIESAISAATAIGFSSTIAMAAMTGGASCASVTAPCGAFPCTGSVTITLGPTCPLPLGGTATGTVVVAGIWESPDQATLGAIYTDVQVADGSSLVVSTTNIVVVRNGDEVSAAYAGQRVSMQEGALELAAQSTWSVEVAMAGTPGDPADDTYTISGAQQSAGQSSTSQITLGSTIVSPACHLNPVDGVATWQYAGSGFASQQVMMFHPACDGHADLLLGQTVLQFYD